MTDSTTPLGQAYLKYMDSLAIEEAKAVTNFHVGRLMLTQGEFDAAVPRLEAALGWNEKLPIAK